MTRKDKPRRPSAGARRTGYVISALLNGLLLVAVNGWPGWEAVPFLTGATLQVLGVVNLSLVVSLVTSLLYLGYDPEWFTALGGLATVGTGLVSTIRLWQVFPFDFGGYSFDWPVVLRVLLIIGIAGSVIGALVQLGTLLRAATRRTRRA
ncbi:hypothetical protein [Amycolatopsis sp. NPDC059657]|uniref:hypothetical protein n=1 Tax=Amycolatopsis sp. NPDC059657 TaxID=3346899 RepID=UPI00366D072D